MDNRGRVYQTVRYGVDPATGTVGNSLTDNTWYDAAGNVIKSQPADAQLFTKIVYDGLGRRGKYGNMGSGLDLELKVQRAADILTRALRISIVDGVVSPGQTRDPGLGRAQGVGKTKRGKTV